MLTNRRTWILRLGLTIALAVSLGPPRVSQPVIVHAEGPCDAPANEIVAENCLPGSPDTEWDVSGAGDPSIQGFATDISVDQGGTVDFKVNTPATDYRLDIYRLGYYSGNGARLVATVQPTATLPQSQPACATDAGTGLVDCGTWAVSASWTVPATSTSGVYLARLVREDGPAVASHIPFIVRDDDGQSNLLFQTSDTTWQAYNQYGGNSLYVGSPAGRAYKVSYNRPITTRGTGPEDWLFNAEYPMIRWLEANGYDVSYTTGVDSDRRGAEILEHAVFLSVGHDEYWSGAQRANVTAARNAGVDLAFFSSNEIFWKTRWENSIDGSGTPYRTLVSYKETHAGAKIDPEASIWTGTWRDPRAFNPEGGQPENALTGQIFTVNCCSYPLTVPAADGDLRFWRNTPNVAALTAGQVYTLPAETLGYEWDEDLDNGARPPGLIRLSTTSVSPNERILDYGSTYGPGDATHHLTLYKHSSGALVFGAGTLQWSWGLDSNHDRGSTAPSVDMQQATVNLLADMGVQPATLQGGLVAATASTDTTAPTSAISSPANGATVEALTSVTIQGSASDGEGGVVGGVEVSTDGGTTWHPAIGRESWSYAWIPQTAGVATLLSRATDDSANLGVNSTPVTVTVEPSTCPCSIWEGGGTPEIANDFDSQPIEVGVKFRASQDGYISALRFYKGTLNTGTHEGHLWTSAGGILASVTFTNETASGWQEVALPSPVAVTADTTYVASYHSSSGYYASTTSGLTTTVSNPPLRALADGEDGPNGVFSYGAPGFPTSSFSASNYWVDVVFVTSTVPDTTPPLISSVAPATGAVDVALTADVRATFSEGMAAGSITTSNFELRDSTDTLVPASVSYDAVPRRATLDPDAPLAPSSTYTATVKGGVGGVTDAAGNPLAADYVWSFTTADPPAPDGPGGPILVIASGANPFSRYYGEILRAEGLNLFLIMDVVSVTAPILADYDVVILGDIALTPGQVTLLTDWVTAGGNLIAMRPDAQLAGLLGLTDTANTLAEGYLLVDTGNPPGTGIVSTTIQYHGTADRYTLNGATAVAMLYSNATTATTDPAVTLRSVGGNGGQAAAFTYDLARSVVYTRQGNPAWAGQERDGQAGPIRPDDLFFGNAAGDPQADWVDLSRVAIPQADEQQRLLVNLIGHMAADRQPLPHFWYFPRSERAVVVMTGDDHGSSGGTAGQFDHFLAVSPANCSVADWECVRSTSYVYTGASLTDAQADSYEQAGFEVALHVNTNCGNWTPASLEDDYATQLAGFAFKYVSVDVPVTNRTHCIAWSDWSTQADVSLAHGIRLDTNYYYWPPAWVNDTPGMFTGSGLPMRFADVNGNLIDVYQAPTQMTDESGQTYTETVAALLDGALGPSGYYGAFVANMHTDNASHADGFAIVAEAQARGVPVISARQLLTWLDGRGASTFTALGWSSDTLTFGITPGAGANGLQAMVPRQVGDKEVSGVTRNGGAISYLAGTIKGVEYVVFDALAGSYVVTYEADPTAIRLLSFEAGSSRLPAGIGLALGLAAMAAAGAGLALRRRQLRRTQESGS